MMGSRGPATSYDRYETTYDETNESDESHKSYETTDERIITSDDRTTTNEKIIVKLKNVVSYVLY